MREEGGGGLLHLVEMVVLVPHKDIECKVEGYDRISRKADKYKKLRAMQIKNKSDLPTREETIPHQSK